ncbi:TPA: deoxyribonuclease IV, partial [Candidatus Micrarchaeota archaeon]|nr:deoxyribonuclease IV [Candidatus Micrarchaeota archaeon]
MARMRLGAHESIAGGLENAVLIGQKLDCESVQLFVKSNRQWSAKPLTEDDIRRFKEAVAATGIHPAV